ncbi:MFS transport protein AraJ [Salmonella enterica subsp. enterica]|uniref:MFS transport protein AraJ n=1 Tax=Salmonella enterica I TaxID=59201 RepID=A0A379WZG5_SALET|nr:MFS transport protein AraJ [Salmonella enterica subsp. enterica]
MNTQRRIRNGITSRLSASYTLIGCDNSQPQRAICAFIFGRWYEKSYFFFWRWVRSDWGWPSFGIMGVLTELARDVGITIPAAGHMISFYAFGVRAGRACYGALFPAAFRLNIYCCFWSTLCVMGNAIFTFSSSYLMLAVGRLVSGFPHGAFFGVGAIVLSKIIRPGKVTAAVAGYGFRNDGGESGGHSGRHLPEPGI